MNYIPSEEESYKSINKIIREINNGNIIKNIHFNGSMFLFLFLNLHIFRGLFYNSYFIYYRLINRSYSLFLYDSYSFLRLFLTLWTNELLRSYSNY